MLSVPRNSTQLNLPVSPLGGTVSVHEVVELHPFSYLLISLSP